VQLTFDLLLLRLEGDTRSLGRSPQFKDHGIFFLTGLTQLLVGHGLLD
jgi:hypothetical protein